MCNLRSTLTCGRSDDRGCQRRHDFRPPVAPPPRPQVHADWIASMGKVMQLAEHGASWGWPTTGGVFTTWQEDHWHIPSARSGAVTDARERRFPTVIWNGEARARANRVVGYGHNPANRLPVLTEGGFEPPSMGIEGTPKGSEKGVRTGGYAKGRLIQQRLEVVQHFRDGSSPLVFLPTL